MRYYNINNILQEEITILNYINVFATLCLWCSIWSNYQLTVRWNRTRRILTKHETLFNTGLYKSAIFEMIIGAVQPYPFLYNVVYHEYLEYDSTKKWVKIEVNDVLLSAMIIMRLYFITRSLLNTSNYLEPRA
jgi:hypothetical protein